MFPFFTLTAGNTNNVRPIKGSGQVTSEIHNLDGFDAIRAGGIFQVFVRSGEDWHVEVTADDNIHQYLNVRVSGNALRLETIGGTNFSPATKIHVHVSMPELTSVRASGASSVYVETPLDQQQLLVNTSGIARVYVDAWLSELEVISSGTSKVHFGGYAHSALLTNSGMSNFGGEEFACEHVVVRLSGTSSARLKAHDGVKGRLSGMSTLYLSGQAGVRVSTSGMSRVHRSR